MTATELFHATDNDRLQCDVCPRACRLADGQHGFCFVRQRQGDHVDLITYGRSSGFCIDPIEKKPLNHFLPGTPVLSFGTAGCNLGCKFCQNWDMSNARELHRMQDHASPEAIAAAAARTHCRSIAYTYNDPVIFLEYAVDTAQAAATHEIKSVAVTAGYITPAARERFFPHMHAANIDLKAFSERFYREQCKASLQPVLETLAYVVNETDCWVETTTLLIPGENDSDAELHAMTQWVVEHLGPDVPMHFTAFHPTYKLTSAPRTPLSTLSRACEIARENGVHHAYTGNVADKDGESTWCAGCGRLLIGRDRYVLSEWELDAGTCPHCGTACHGVFEATPGDWGARRQRVVIGG